MKVKDILVHLRFPFSYFLAPVFLLALTLRPLMDSGEMVLWFVVIHFFIYPASNAFNSYYDKDEGPIGGIRTPPPVDRSLLFASLTVELVGLIIIYTVSLWAAIIFLILGFMSKAYSWDKIRLKKYPIASLATIALFQGSVLVLSVVFCGSDGPLSQFPVVPGTKNTDFFKPEYWLAALAACLFLLAVYPLTQVYQHEEDAEHGDMTYSRLVGISGTFFHSFMAFSLACIVFASYFIRMEGWHKGMINMLFFTICLLPALVFFTAWWIKARRNSSEANFTNTMTMNFLASTGLNVFFILKLMRVF